MRIENSFLFGAIVASALLIGGCVGGGGGGSSSAGTDPDRTTVPSESPVPGEVIVETPVAVPSDGSATGVATLSWTPPTRNIDGTPLTNLAGYRIHFGTSEGSYPSKLKITNPGITEYTVESLQNGITYFFVVTALNSLGAESPYSAVVSKKIN